jgi:hypothetical protein
MKHQKPSKPVEHNSRQGGASRSFIRSEWPLLLYPVLVLAAVGVVFVVNRPYSRDHQPKPESANKPAETRVVGSAKTGSTAEAAESVRTAPAAASANSAMPQVGPKSGQPSPLNAKPAGTPPAMQPTEIPETDDSSGPGRLVALLRQAVRTNNQADLKTCLDAFVAAGDSSVRSLTDLVLGGNGAVGVWAAEALARIGTPAATCSLLDALSRMADGRYKEQVAKRVSNISNQDSWPNLMEAIQTTEDPAVRRAAGASLARMADAPIVSELMARYDASTTPEEAADWARTVGSISSAKASDSLLTLARQVPSNPQDVMDQSILDAVANVGDARCVNYLLSRLEACAPGEGAYMMNLIGKISQPQAESALLYAAAGNKEVSAEQGRTAAILALKNYPSEQTYVLLEQIASTERNATVATAASRTLAGIQHSQPLLAANVQVQPADRIVSPARTQK